MKSPESGRVGPRAGMTARKEPKSQSDRFIETARELDCDEDEDRFNETLKRVAPSRQKKNQPETEHDKE